MVRQMLVRTTAAAAIPVIASYLLGSSLLNLHRVACCQFRWIPGRKVSVRDPQGLRSLINHGAFMNLLPTSFWRRIFLQNRKDYIIPNSERQAQRTSHKNNNFLSFFLRALRLIH